MIIEGDSCLGRICSMSGFRRGFDENYCSCHNYNAAASTILHLSGAFDSSEKELKFFKDFSLWEDFLFCV